MGLRLRLCSQRMLGEGWGRKLDDCKIVNGWKTVKDWFLL